MRLKSCRKKTYWGRHISTILWHFCQRLQMGFMGDQLADNPQGSNVLKDISWIDPGAPSPLIYRAGAGQKVKCNWGARRVPLRVASVAILDVQQSSSREGLSCTKQVPHAPSPLLWIIALAPSHPAEDLGMQKSENRESFGVWLEPGREKSMKGLWNFCNNGRGVLGISPVFHG